MIREHRKHERLFKPQIQACKRAVALCFDFPAFKQTKIWTLMELLGSKSLEQSLKRWQLPEVRRSQKLDLE